MKTSTRRLATMIAALSVGASVAFAPIAAAEPVKVPVGPADVTAGPVGESGTDPLVPVGTLPTVPWTLGFLDSDHDNGYTTNGEVDLPF